MWKRTASGGGWRANQKMVSILSFLFGGDFSTICFCRSMNVEPLLANNLRRLITESSLKPATARSACTRLYLHFPKSINLWIEGLDIFFKQYSGMESDFCFSQFCENSFNINETLQMHTHRKTLINDNYNSLEEELF